MIVDPVQLFVIGLVATLVAQVLKILFSRWGWRPGKAGITLIAFVLSMGLAVAFNVPELPSAVDPMEFAKALISAASTIMGPATIIYNLLLEKLLVYAGRKFNFSLTP